MNGQPVIKLGDQITREEILSYEFGTPKVLVLRFKEDGFEGACALAMLMEEFPGQLTSPFGYSALVDAFIEGRWPTPTTGWMGSNERVFIIVQHLHEKPEVLDRFISTVVPFLDCSVLVAPDFRFEAGSQILAL